MYTLDLHGPWGLYTSTTPPGATVLGTITRQAGDTGALVQTSAGIYAQCNAGILRSLNQRQVRQALHEASDHGPQLKAWREQVQLTQAEAATLFGVHQVTYAKWEASLQGMTGAALRLAQVLETPQGYRLVARLARAGR